MTVSSSSHASHRGWPVVVLLMAVLMPAGSLSADPVVLGTWYQFSWQDLGGVQPNGSCTAVACLETDPPSVPAPEPVDSAVSPGNPVFLFTMPAGGAQFLNFAALDNQTTFEFVALSDPSGPAVLESFTPGTSAGSLNLTTPGGTTFELFIDTASGAASGWGVFQFSDSAASAFPAPVPEPSALVLVGPAIAVLFTSRRLRRRGA